MYPLIQVQVDLCFALTRVIKDVVSGHPFYQECGEALCKCANVVHNRPLVVWADGLTGSMTCGWPSLTASYDAKNYCSWPVLRSTKVVIHKDNTSICA